MPLWSSIAPNVLAACEEIEDYWKKYGYRIVGWKMANTRTIYYTVINPKNVCRKFRVSNHLPRDATEWELAECSNGVIIHSKSVER